MKEITKFELLDKPQTANEKTFYFFFRKNYSLHAEIWNINKHGYFCNFEKYNYTKKQFLKCLDHLLNYENIKIFED
jgi:hypothetical protein